MRTRLRLVVALGAAVLAAGAVAVTWAFGGLAAAGELAGLLSGLGTLISWLLRQGFGRRRSSTAQQARRAAEELARQLRAEWAAEARSRQLRDPRPLAVRWVAWGSPGSAEVVRPGRADEIGSLVADFRRCGRRLVILGPSGSGKSDLAVLLALGLLEDRRPGDAVPVVLSASTWDHDGEAVEDWMKRRLAAEHPALGNADTYGDTVVSDLVALRAVFPVLDGLDELAPPARARALRALNRSFGGADPLIVTCRTGEYQDTVTVSRMLSAAAVIELEPVRAVDAVAFLSRGDAGSSLQVQGWRPVFDLMGRDPGGHLAVTMSSALMIALARDVYDASGADPAELTRFPDQAAIEGHLLGALIPARLGGQAGRSKTAGRRVRPTDPGSAVRWLTFLAMHLNHLGMRDLAWWQLRRALPGLWFRRQRALLPALVAWPVTGVLFGFAKGLTAGAAAGVIAGVLQGLDVALIIGSAYLFESSPRPAGTLPASLPGRLSALGRRALIAVLCGAGYAVASGVRDGIELGPLTGLKAGLINWSVVAVLAGLADALGLFTVTEEPTHFNLRLPGRRRQLLRALASGAGQGAAFGLIAGYGVKLSASLAGARPLWLMGAPGGAAIGLGFALAAWGRAAAESGEAASPRSTLQADRALVLLLPIPLVVILAVCYGIAFGAGSPGGLLDGLRYGIYGLALGLALWLVIAFTRAWPWYVAGAAWLALRGRLPWRLAAFLADAHELRILRQVGGAYQFRHGRLQDHLALRANPGRPGAAPVAAQPASSPGATVPLP